METGTIISLAAVLISFIALIMNGRQGTRTDAAQMAQIGAKLDNAVTGINDIRVEIRTMRESITDHGERLAMLEARVQRIETDNN